MHVPTHDLEHHFTQKILILGGNTAQIPLIEASHCEGYYVVLCDNTTTNPGIRLVDKHYQENFQDREKVLEIAVKEGVKGIISNSESAMPVVAYVSEQLDLVGNSLESVQTLNSKIKFRALQKRLGIFVPNHVVTSSFSEALETVSELHFPIIMKPCRSSGSRGTTRIDSFDELSGCCEKWKKCSLYSIDRRVVLEEFIEMPSLDRVIDGDIFVLNDRILWDGLFTSKRSESEPMLPMTQTFPILLDEPELEELKSTVKQLLSGAGIKFGEFNIEFYYTSSKRLFCIEINARQGGNGIPEMIHKHCGIDMYKLLVTTVMGNNDYFDQITRQPREVRFVSRHPVFSHSDGIFNRLVISSEIKPYVIAEKKYVESGTAISRGVMARDKLAMIDLEFPNRETQLFFISNIEKYIYPDVR